MKKNPAKNSSFVPAKRHDGPAKPHFVSTISHFVETISHPGPTNSPFGEAKPRLGETKSHLGETTRRSGSTICQFGSMIARFAEWFRRVGGTRTWFGLSAEAQRPAGRQHSCRRTIGSMLLLTLGGTLPLARGQVVTVAGTANIFGAGHAVPPAPAGGGAGTLPTTVMLPLGCTRSLTFSPVSGMISGITPPNFLPPDGGTSPSTNINSWGGISGISVSRGLPLVGVFCSATEPSDPAPVRLVLGDGIGFATLSPLLNQTFFIGDGLTGQGSGSQQVFIIPEQATRLFLGFADAGSFVGNPGLYGDNQGMLRVSVAVGGTGLLSIQLQPQDMTACPAGIASFSVAAAGAGPFVYRWKRATPTGEFVDLNDGTTTGWDGGATNARIGAIVSGSTTANLTIRADTQDGRILTPIHATRFRCLVSNACVSVTSAAANLLVCTGDFDDGTATGRCDGGVTIDDLLYYLSLYAQGLIEADIDNGFSTGTPTGTPDGGVTIDDLLYYLARYAAGC